MAWFKVDDGFHDHPKVDNLSLEAIGLWLVCATWSSRHLTDGVVPSARVVKLGGNDELCSELVRANMWRTSEDVRNDGSPNAYEYVNWDDWNPTKDDVQNERQKARERMQNLRSKRSEQGKRSPEQTANERRTSEDVRNPVPSRPVPIESAREARSGSRKRPSTPLPDDWQPSDSHIEKAREQNIDLNHEAEKFKNDALAKDKRFVDWGKAFHTWLARVKDFSPDYSQTSDPNAYLWR